MTAARITLAIGGEAFLVDRAIASVAARVRAADPSVQRFVIDAADEDAPLALREACAPTLFGDGALVIVRSADQADDAAAAAIREVIADLPGNVFLVLAHPGGVKGKALVDAVKAAGADVVACANVKGKQFGEFVSREFASHRRKVTAPAVAALLESVGSDLGLLSAAVSQLVTDLDADHIDVTDVRAYFEGVADVSGFAISDAVWDRRRLQALTLLRQSMLANEAGRIGPMAVAALASGARGMARVGGLPARMSEAAAAKEAGVPPWKVKDLRRQWAKWGRDQRRLAAAVVALAEADGAVKGGVLEGSSLDPVQKLLLVEALVAAASAPSTGPVEE